MMIPRVRDILNCLDEIAPGELAEPWDNCGLCAGGFDWPVKKILVSLDPCMAALAAARQWQADMVLTHHPLFITPEKTIDFQRMPGVAIQMAAREQIAIVCAHTNLDKVPGGLNDVFADRIGMACDGPLETDSGVSSFSSGGQLTGIGRVGSMPAAMPLSRLVSEVKTALGIPRVRMVGSPDRMVRTVAVCTGSGGSLVPAFLTSGADVYISGDIKYHEARDIEAYGRSLIDVGHFASEIIAVALLCHRMTEVGVRNGYDIQVHAYDKETDPFISV